MTAETTTSDTTGDTTDGGDAVIDVCTVDASTGCVEDVHAKSDSVSSPTWLIILVVGLLIVLVLLVVLLSIMWISSSSSSSPVYGPGDPLHDPDMPPKTVYVDSQGNIISDFNVSSFVRQHRAWLVGGGLVVGLLVVAIVVMIVVLVVRRREAEQHQQDLLEQERQRRRQRRQRQPTVRLWPATPTPFFSDTPVDTPTGFLWWAVLTVAVMSAVFVAVRRASDPSAPNKWLYFVLTVSLVWPAWRAVWAVVHLLVAGLHHYRVWMRRHVDRPGVVLLLRVVHTVLSILLLPVLVVFMLLFMLRTAMVFIMQSVTNNHGTSSAGDDLVVEAHMVAVSVTAVGLAWRKNGLAQSVTEGEQAFKNFFQTQ